MTVVATVCSCFYSKERKSVANGLSPGIEEQSEYFDATENPLFKDKRQDLDDEDSGVDNASQILRESSVSRFVVSTFSILLSLDTFFLFVFSFSKIFNSP